MENKCKICNEISALENYVRNSVRCSKCHSIFIKNNNIEQYPSITADNKAKLTLEKKFSKLIAESYLKYINSKTGLSFKKGLDIGAGFGHFVDCLNKHGIKTIGIESNNEITDQTSNLIHANFDENYNSETKYDFIALNQCIYYFPDTFIILKKLSTMLENNGILFITTVNPESSFRLENKILAQGCKMCLSDRIFRNLTNYNLKLEDITSFNDNLYVGYFLHKKGKISHLKFYIDVMCYLLKLKKIVTIKSNDGINNFILLRKIEVSH